MERRRTEFKRTLEQIKKLGNERGKDQTVFFGTDYARTLAQTAAIPEAMKTSFDLSCIRRKNTEGYHYFISALTGKDTESWIPLAVPARSAMLYNPMNGASGKALLRQKDGKTEVYSGMEVSDCCAGNCRTVRFMEPAVCGKRSCGT